MQFRRIYILFALASVVTARAWAVDQPLSGCTILTISQGGQVFFGGNDDYHSRDKTYWTDPGGDAAYGAIYFGAPNNIQQGFNEKGLAYDANGLPSSAVVDHDGILPGPGRYELYPIAILRECATVGEVIKWIAEHRWHTSMRDQLHFADASGDAVVVSVGVKGRVVYTRKRPGDAYLVSTNFNLANPQNGDHPSWRYDLATRRASELLQSKVSENQVASIMEAVHIENPRSFTVYTVVADLVSGQVTVYFMFQYDAPIVLDIQAELAKGPVQTSLRSIFPESTVARADAALGRLNNANRARTIIGFAWAGVVLICAVLWIFLPMVNEGGGTLLFTIVVLGPIGLLIGLVSHGATRNETDNPVAPPRRSKCWAAALSNAGLDAASIILPLAAGVLLMVIVPAIGAFPSSFLMLLVIAPVVFSLIAVHAPRLSSTTQLGFLRSVVRSAAPSFFSSSLMIATMLPLLFPFTLWLAARLESLLVLTLAVWVLTVLVCLVGVFLLAVFYRGFRNSQSGAGRRRLCVTALMIFAGVILLIAGLYLVSRTVWWFAPSIEGASTLL